jgi:class 3 adenylate cyclase/ligand-binding sensor domain-containing protein
MFLINDKLYLTKTSNGLFEMEHDSLILVPNTTDFGTLPIRAIFPADKSDELKGYVFTANNGILLYDGKNLHKVNNKLNDILKTLNVTTVIKLDNGYMAIGTQSSGIFIADENLNIIKIIDESLGLLDNNIRSLMVDKDGSIWAGLNYGISKIDYPYCITFFDKSLGIKGTVQKIYKDGENLYLATSLGILKYIDDGNDKFYFKKIFPINDNVWDLMNYHGNFLVATDHGVVIANGESIKLISNELDKSLVLYESKLFAGRIFIGLDNGLASIKYDHGKFVYEGRIEGINYRVRSILETDDGKLWVSYDKASRIDFSKGFSNHPPVETYDKSEKIKKDFSTILTCKINGKILFGTSIGLFSFNEKLKMFQYDSTLGKRFCDTSHEASAIIEDKKGNIWVSSEFRYGPLIPTNNSYKFDTLPFMKMPSPFVWYIFPEDNGVVWFGASEGIYRYDPSIKFYYKNDFNTLIRKVKIDGDSTIFNGTFADSSGNFIPNQTASYNYSISNSRNDINFEYCATSYKSKDKLVYSFMLEGKDKQWSAWTKESKKEYSELFEGKYIFKVKSKNLYGIESKEATFEFTVLPPWFRTWCAILIWAGLLAFFIWLIIILNHKRLIAAKRRLEIIVKERTKEIIHQKEIIEEEKVKSDNLLLNILPAEVAEELKQTGKSKAKSYESVSVLFIDIKDFTKISASQTPERIVADIDQCFRGFDDIVQKYGLEKIKTIGDAYMCAGGLPMKNSTHPVDIVNAALEIRDFIENLKREKMKNNESYFDVRIGISSGPVVAGIVGNKKFAYDIWGDTVNTASRMETNGEIGKVNISNSTFELIKDKFKCTHRGKMPVKNKGDVDMYFVEFKI